MRATLRPNPSLLLIVPLVAALMGWCLVNVDWVQVTPQLECRAAISQPMVLEDLSGASESKFLLTVVLAADFPEVVLVYQVIDRNGFGWLVDRVGREEARLRKSELATGHPIQTIRVGIMSPSEHERAIEIGQAASGIGLVEWVRLRGWQAPSLAICERFDV